jgi:hypothetical protein
LSIAVLLCTAVAVILAKKMESKSLRDWAHYKAYQRQKLFYDRYATERSKNTTKNTL